MSRDRSYTWLISKQIIWPTKPTRELHRLSSLKCWSKKKICNLRQLNEANYISYSFQKTYQNIIFRRNVSLTEPLQLQGHWWHYEMDTLKFYEGNLVWIGEEVVGVLCKSLGGGVPLGHWNPNPQYLDMVNLIHSQFYSRMTMKC